MALSHNLERGTIYINRFYTGLYTNRGPVFVPISTTGLQAISRFDTLADGLNMEPTHTMTLARRAGFARFGSVTLSAGEIAQSFFGFKDTSGTLRTMLETNTRVSTFTSGSITSVITKNTTNQGSMSKVGDMFYYCDGDSRDLLKWDGTNLWKWGIDAPMLAPTLSFGTGSLTTVNGGYSYLFVHKNSRTGHISCASPVSAATLNFTNKTITIRGQGGSDTQADQVEIYRTDDGGGIFYYLTTISTVAEWSFADNYKDADLNTYLRVYPTLQNTPPPSDAHLACFHQGRYFIAAGSYLYFSGGPDIVNGVPEESFGPGNVMRFPGKITALASTTQGLAVFTSSDMYAVLGTDTLSFFPRLVNSNFGVATQNCIAKDGDSLVAYTTQRQLYTIADLTEVGNPIQNKLFRFDPMKVYLAVHRNGPDEGLFVSNGVDTMYRYSVTLNAWSTPYTIAGGCGAVASIETTTANYTLLLARAAAGTYLLQRDIATHADDGTPYAAFAVVGTIPLIGPGQTISIDSVIVDASPAGTYPKVSVRINEIAGPFTELPNPVPEPASIPASKSLIVRRHFLSQADIARDFCRTLQVRFDFSAEDAASEIYELAIMPGDA